MKDKRKPRHRTIEMDFGEPVHFNEVRIHTDGQIEMLRDGEAQAPSRGHVEIHYKREKKGPKVLSRAPIDGARLPSHPEHVVARADRLFWIDTNSKEFDNGWVHACSVIIGEPVQDLGQSTLLAFQVSHGIEFRGVIERPEALAWCELIEGLRMNPKRLLHWDICLVVDSDLGRLSRINERLEPVWGDYFLPGGFRLAYATADSGRSDQPLNKVMFECDRNAAALLKTIREKDPGGQDITSRSRVGQVMCRRWNYTD